jgi:hypothetical protein
MCAAIVHDIGKTREFSYGAAIELSDQGRMLGHVQIGLALLAERGGAPARRPTAARARSLRALPPRRRRRPAGASRASRRSRSTA